MKIGEVEDYTWALIGPMQWVDDLSEDYYN